MDHSDRAGILAVLDVIAVLAVRYWWKLMRCKILDALDTHDGLSIVLLDRFRYVSLKSGVSDRWLAYSMLDGRERKEYLKRGILLSASPIDRIAACQS